MTVAKLILITIFMYFSSKAFFCFLKNKIKINHEIGLGLGYFCNLALFFVLNFLVMLFKLSSTFLMIAGVIYLAISLIFIILSIKNKELFKFTKKEIIALIIAIIFMLCFALCIDFGHIETYDSYYYALLSNSSVNANSVSVIDPYTSLSNMDNFYKYISYYHQAGFLGKIFNLSTPSLALIWTNSFMNFFFIAISALGVARISKKEYVNNIITVFVLTTFLSVIRAPYNGLHLVTLISCFYLVKYGYEVLENKKYSLTFYLITTIACISITSTTLFVTLPVVYLILIANSILKKRDDFKDIFILAIPSIVLGFLYIYESTNNLGIMIASICLIIGIYILLHSKIMNKLVSFIGKILVFLIPIILFVIPYIMAPNNFSQNFTKRDELSAEESLPETSTSNPLCITNGIYEIEVDDFFDNENHSTSMNYIYNKKTSTISTILIYFTHSLLKYGGMLFLFIYGIFKLRKDPIYLGYLIYLLTFFNPFITNGLAMITVNLNTRINLFFNMFFAVYGLKYFFIFVEELIEKHQLNNIWNKIKNKIWILLAILFAASIFAFVSLFKNPDWNKYDAISKVPETFIEASNIINKEFAELNKRPRVFYTASAFNITMIDDNPNDHIKVINSKEYMNFYTNQNYITDKILINIYFETEGLVNLESIIDLDDELVKSAFNIDSCEINALLESYGVNYIVTKNPSNKKFKKYLEENFKIIYENSEIIFIKVVD